MTGEGSRVPRRCDTRSKSQASASAVSCPCVVCLQCLCGASLVARSVKNPPATQETRFRSLGREEGHGTPFQYSRLENPTNRGAWGATVHRIMRVGHDLATKPPLTAGGALGAFLRYWAGILSSMFFGAHFPVGTLAVNVAGSFIIGMTAAALAAGKLPVAPWNDLIMQGFCGALTTFSTFSIDSFQMFRQGRALAAWGHIALSTILCLSAAALGLSVFTQA